MKILSIIYLTQNSLLTCLFRENHIAFVQRWKIFTYKHNNVSLYVCIASSQKRTWISMMSYYLILCKPIKKHTPFHAQITIIKRIRFAKKINDGGGRGCCTLCNIRCTNFIFWQMLPLLHFLPGFLHLNLSCMVLLFISPLSSSKNKSMWCSCNRRFMHFSSSFI